MLVHFVLCCFLMWKSQSAFGQSIVSTNVIEEGGTFTVTCDASRAGVPTSATTVVSLVIAWTAGTAAPTTYARYKIIVPPPYNSTFLPQTSPARNWTFNFSGSQQGTSDTPNNRNTMKIEMVVYDAKCTDSGWFYCNATYLTTLSELVATHQYQKVTGITRTVDIPETLVLQYTMEPSQNGSVNSSELYAVLTCTCTGPKELNFTWKYGPSSSDVNSFTSYPVQSDISVAEPVLVSSGTTCVQYRHTSRLKFRTEDNYDGYMYVCVATANNKDTVVGNMTIYTKKAFGQTIVSPSVIEERGSFTVTCDASRAGVPTNVSTVLRLTISWSNATASPETYAEYRLDKNPYNLFLSPETSPARNWTFNFSGSQQGTSDTPNNRNTMKIEMVVYDAKCTDAGWYYCTATYSIASGDQVSTVQYQNVKRIMSTSIKSQALRVLPNPAQTVLEIAALGILFGFIAKFD